jgi:hypothetical protein
MSGVEGEISPSHEVEPGENIDFAMASSSRLQVKGERRTLSRVGSRSSNQSLNQSDGSRRSSADSSMAIGADGSTRLGKRKRKTENDDSVIESNYSLRRRRGSRMVLDGMNGNHDAAEIKQDSTNLPGIAIDEAKEGSTFTPEVNDAEFNEDQVPDSLAPIFPRRRGRRQYRFRAETPVESTVGTPIPGTPLNGNDLAAGVGTDQEPTKMVRRLPGRRRAPNANPSIEADLRRQLNLKMSYRSVVKALKPILAELARRSIDELETEDELYQQCDEYTGVENELYAYLNRRLSQVNGQLEYGQLLNDKDLEDGRVYFQMQFEVHTKLIVVCLIH